MGSMMKYVRDREIAPEIVVPIPQGWSFSRGGRQQQLTVGRKMIHRYKLLYGF